MSEQGQSGEQPKIIIDSDWKKQAQAEKDRLAQAEATNKQQGETEPGAAPPGADPNRPVDLMDIIKTLASQALMYMGAFPDPESGKAVVAPDLAKAHIDMLGVLQDKTKGNLTDEEHKTLNGILNDLRMQFVEVSKAVAKAVEEGKISPSGGTAPGFGAGPTSTGGAGPRPGPGLGGGGIPGQPGS